MTIIAIKKYKYYFHIYITKLNNTKTNIKTLELFMCDSINKNKYILN